MYAKYLFGYPCKAYIKEEKKWQILAWNFKTWFLGTKLTLLNINNCPVGTTKQIFLCTCYLQSSCLMI